MLGVVEYFFLIVTCTMLGKLDSTIHRLSINREADSTVKEHEVSIGDNVSRINQIRQNCHINQLDLQPPA